MIIASTSESTSGTGGSPVVASSANFSVASASLSKVITACTVVISVRIPSTSGKYSDFTSNALASEFEITYDISWAFKRELIGPATAPNLQHAKYAITYSALFGNSKPTASPFLIPYLVSMTAERLTAASNSA